MTATQAPTPGPLTSESVKLLVKGDLLRCINPHTISVKEGEIRVFERRTHNEPGAGNDIVLSDSHLGTWSGIFAFIGRPDESVWMPWSGGENPVPGRRVEVKIRWRNGVPSEWPVESDVMRWKHQKGHSKGGDIIAFRLAPTAPVEASGSERERLARAIDPYAWDDAQYAEPGGKGQQWSQEAARKAADRVLALRPQPSGETRARIAYLEAQVEEARSLIRIATDAAEDEGDRLYFGSSNHADWLREWAEKIELLSTTPARAEAQDEGAAGELKPCPFCGGEAEIIHLDDDDNAGGSCVCCTKCQASGNVEFGRKENFVENWNRRAHPSPPPAADADRVRIAVEEMADAVDFFDRVKASTQAEQIAVGRDHWNRLEAAARAVAALKSEGK